MALGSSVPDTPKALGRFVQSVRRQTCGVPAAKFHRMYRKIWSEKKQSTPFHTRKLYSRDVALIIPFFFWFHTFHPFFCWSPTSCLTIGKSSTKIPPPFEAVLTLLSARPKAAAPSVAHGLRPLVVAFFGVGKTGRRWNSAGVSQKYLKSLELSM